MTLVEALLYVGGIMWIYGNFATVTNQTLYMLALTGVGFILVFIAFFVAIFANHHRQEP
jgi:hypothetical protein